jgi:hypothetical protein
MKPRAEFVPHYMAVSPSPLELFERLSADEQVAIDLILHACSDDDVRLRALVPAEGRRGYLRTLAMQLPSCKADGALDADVATWAAARARYDEEERTARQERVEAEQRDREWLETLPAVVRRSVERQRRRRAARRGRG